MAVPAPPGRCRPTVLHLCRDRDRHVQEARLARQPPGVRRPDRVPHADRLADLGSLRRRHIRAAVDPTQLRGPRHRSASWKSPFATPRPTSAATCSPATTTISAPTRRRSAGPLSCLVNCSARPLTTPTSRRICDVLAPALQRRAQQLAQAIQVRRDRGLEAAIQLLGFGGPGRRRSPGSSKP